MRPDVASRQSAGRSWQQAAGSWQKTGGLKRLTGTRQLAGSRSVVGRIDVVVISPVGIGQIRQENFVEVFHVTYCHYGDSRFGQIRHLHHKKLGLVIH